MLNYRLVSRGVGTPSCILDPSLVTLNSTTLCDGTSTQTLTLSSKISDSTQHWFLALLLVQMLSRDKQSGELGVVD